MLRERLTAQLLAGPPARDPVGVAERLLAVQAQDPRGARLAIRARTTGLTAADVDRALTENRSLVVTWLNRGTLHLVRSEDYPWLQALTTPPLFAGNARRLAQEGVSPDDAERGVEAIERALADEGPLTRMQLRERVRAVGVPAERQALVHVLMLASLRGLVVRGPVVGKQHAYVLVRDWLGRPQLVDRELALAELVRRYLVGHGPANERDVAKWAGLPLRDARAGLSAISRKLVERDDGLVDLRRRTRVHDLPPPRLLGQFEPVLLGWRCREPLVGRHESLLVSGGLFRPFALVGGRAVAAWRLVDRRVELEPFAKLSGADAAALETDADELLQFLAG
jgi:hypothetical protein